MSFVSDSLSNLVNGVSQQPASLRLRTQSQDEVNRWSSIVDGNRKRSPTSHVALLNSGTYSGAFGHKIDRTPSQRFTMAVTPGDLKVFTLAGVEKTVTFADRTETLQAAAVATGNGLSQVIWCPSTVTTITLATTGITTATVIWERDDNAAFTSAETVRTDTVDTSGTITHTPATHNGWYYRARISAWTSGAITATVTWASSNYLGEYVQNAKTDFRATTVADYTFIVNRTMTVAQSGIASAVRPAEALVYIETVQPSIVLEIHVDGVKEGNYTYPASAMDALAARDNLYTDLDGSGTISGTMTFEKIGPSIYLTDTSDFDFYTADGWGDNILKGFKNTVQRFTDLPSQAKDGMVLEVVGDPESNNDNYFVKYDNSGGADGRGVWTETFEPGLDNTLLAETMPHTLVYNVSTDDFSFGEQVWDDRTVGDAVSSPAPSFVGQQLNDVFFFRNRLGFTSDENMIMSASGDYFRFWRKTILAVLDGDPIDVSGTHTEVAILEHATAWNEKLLLFANNAQFVVDPGSRTLTPQTVSIDFTTAFDVNVDAPPLALGSNVYFASDLGNFSQVYEYYVTDDLETNDASDITSHVPKYVPNDLFILAGSPKVKAMVGVSSDTLSKHKLWVYKYLWGGSGGREKLQSSWNVWEFEATDEIVWADFFEQVLYLMIQRSDGLYLECVDLQEDLIDDVTYQVMLDRKTELTGVYDSPTDLTTWTLPYPDATSVNFRVVLGDTGFTGEVGDYIPVTHATTTTLTASGDYSGGPSFVGREYDSTYTFSEFQMRERQGNGEVAIKAGRLQIKTLTVTYDDTGYFQAIVVPAYRATYTYTFSGAIAGQAIIGAANIVAGSFRFPVGAKAEDVTITLSNSTHKPDAFLSAEWEGEFTLRSRRV